VIVYKIAAAVLVLTGLFLIAKYGYFPAGLILMFIGFFVGLKLGLKPR